MKKLVIRALAATVIVSSLSGCIGQMATSGMVMQMNLSAVDNRYARAGLYMLMSPVYGIAATADLFVFNTIEFWTGKNPISGKSPAVADTPAKSVIRINDKLTHELKTAPLNISQAEVNQIDDQTLEIMVSFVDGTTQTLRGEKSGENVLFYADGQYITTASILELENYAANRI